MAEERVRVRLAFEDREILSKPQRSEGLDRSWLLLNPQHHDTISQLAAHLLRIFNLHHSCPNGLLLQMDGFVLPPFESTCILKDKEIICVKRKGGVLADAIEDEDAVNLLNEAEIVEKQPVDTDLPLLANEEFDKETDDYESESEEYEDDQEEDTQTLCISSGANAASKKRKASTELPSSKKKKHCLVVLDIVENETKAALVDNNHHEESHPRDGGRKKEKITGSNSIPKRERTDKKVESGELTKRSDQPLENGQTVEQVAAVPNGFKKLPSRSARRKKAKRQWLREVAKISKKKPHGKPEHEKAENKEIVCHQKGLLHWKQPKSPLTENRIDQKENHKYCDPYADIVPVVVRPGHIRFEPLEKDQEAQSLQVSNASNWNGITSKKKGQKWGREKFSSARGNGYENSNKEWSSQKWGAQKFSSARGNDYENSKKEWPVTKNEKVPLVDPINFDKLPLVNDLPQRGDVIAYRVLELSSSWTPEVSSFRVGRISWRDLKSTKVILTPVLEYPLVTESADENTPDSSIYREDGSLEIKFSSLIDVRSVKQSDSDPGKAIDRVIQTPPGNKEATSSVLTSNNESPTHVSTANEINLWDQFSEALSAKKEGLSVETDWSNISSGTDPWSYRALRGSAIGPTMALLRSNNNI